jgi:hypothetical protein
MIMDYLRAGYTAPARWRAAGDDTMSIRWYRAAPGARVYPLLHAFGSTVWDVPSDVANTGPGEVPLIRTWAGSPPAVPAGLTSPTPAEYFAGGVPLDADLPSCETHVNVSACGCGFSTTFAGGGP